MDKIFQKFGLRYPAAMTYARVGEHEKYPYIRPSDFIKAMASSGDLGRLLADKASMSEAGPLLVEFWSRYRKMCPEHALFKSCVPLDRAVPLYLHGDEGTTYKKSAVLLISFQSAMGHGSSRRSIEAALTEHELDLQRAGIPVNFLRTGLRSRFLCAMAPKDRV